MFIMAGSGLWFWWPDRKLFKSGFRVMWRCSTDIRWRTLHRVVGAVAGPVLLVTALTGILMVWKEPLRGLVGAAGKPTPAVAEPAVRPLEIGRASCRERVCQYV